ncbi:hypothetical protein [Clostridium intestinale]|uniref:hypothetical protein n=1 Tax=Clostridium intestinale TaxID=36845 RepID=UPI0028EA067D|nr:hypothetical protein [Clostridium intestinale]
MILLLLVSGFGWFILGTFLLVVLLAFIGALKDAYKKQKEQQRIEKENEIFEEMRDRQEEK